MKTWLTSDTHFWHANIIKYCLRPFMTAQDPSNGIVSEEAVIKMNETIINNWNKVVSPDDKVIHLGDFAMAAKAVETIVPRLNGNIELYLGNHDFPHPAHKRGRTLEQQTKWTDIYKKWGFKKVELEGFLDVPGVANFRLFHLPYSGPENSNSEGKPRHFKERLEDDGMPLLCGHVHQHWTFNRTPKGTPQINVGVDSPNSPWSGQFRPASLDEVMQIYLENTKNDKK